MASIDSYLTAIKEAVYGEEVRDSIHDAIKAINDEVEESLDTAEGILNQLTEANETAEDNIDTLNTANTTATSNISSLSTQNTTAESNIEDLTEANEDSEEILNTIYNSLGGLTFTVNDDGTVTVDVSES